MKILVINGVNLNMLGIREPGLYGNSTYKDLVKKIKLHAKNKGVKVKCFQSNSEGDICTAIQKAYKKFNGIVKIKGFYVHYKGYNVATFMASKAVEKLFLRVNAKRSGLFMVERTFPPKVRTTLL